MKSSKQWLITILIWITTVMVILGLLICFSTTMADYFRGIPGIAYPWSGIVKQLIAALLGIFLLFFARVVPMTFFRKNAVMFFVISLILLLVVLFIGSTTENEAGQDVSRFIRIAGLTFQPSELVKLTAILLIARRFTGPKAVRFTNKNILKTLIWVFFLPSLLIIVQPNFSAAMLYFVIVSFTLIFAGMSYWKYLFRFILPISLVLTIGLILTKQADRILSRIFNYLALYANSPFVQRIAVFSKQIGISPEIINLLQEGDTFQVNASFRTIAQGRWLGYGFLKSTQKFGNLPYNSTDFVFAVISEEFGNILSACLILLFFILFYISIQISLKSRDHFNSVVAAGVGMHLFLQAFTHIAVTLGLVPPTGVTLPFISVGGTSLMIILFEIGILLNIASQIKEPPVLAFQHV
jgi:cell division protein FtsW (lipid II flippase)